ncbi:hypothetical protein [Shimia sp. MMG029]|uniref:hypothetical protein n=1 Tax=Shimia sp. MMG029 TaxID=3021978 RepID=UPI0022FE15FF|nr:hypothetical protein [Shimia sp. MMG029]MDA5555950.1 hypothetical protein [Shimia sp. MMG029]
MPLLKHATLATSLLLVLSSCTEFGTYYKEGVTKSQLNIDRGQCNRAAADAYPPNIVTDWWPIYDRYGRVVSQRAEQYDLNEGARHTAVRECMAANGYERVKIPFCKDDQLGDNHYAKIEVAPELTPSICGLKTENGGRVLIDLSKPISSKSSG